MSLRATESTAIDHLEVTDVDTADNPLVDPDIAESHRD
jgi:hypothetical protein